jgi:transposase-like protein
MKGLEYKDYFVKPVETSQRRYEALRAVFVDEQSMKDVAEHFDISYGTLRNWVSEFCRGHGAGQRPPFSHHHCVDVLRAKSFARRMNVRQSKLPM